MIDVVDVVDIVDVDEDHGVRCVSLYIYIYRRSQARETTLNRPLWRFIGSILCVILCVCKRNYVFEVAAEGIKREQGENFW